MTRPDWSGALCVGHMHLFDSARRDDHEIAAAMCGYCPRLDQCAQVLDEWATQAARCRPTGTWAGRLINHKGDIT